MLHQNEMDTENSKAAMGDTSLPYCGKETELRIYFLNQQGCNFSVVTMIEVCLERNSTDSTPGTSLRQYVPGAGAINRAPTTAHTWSETQQVYPGAPLNRANWHPHDHHSPLV